MRVQQNHITLAISLLPGKQNGYINFICLFSYLLTMFMFIFLNDAICVNNFKGF